MTYQSWRRTKEYKNWRLAVIRRDKHCKFPLCRSRRHLQVHHIIEYNYAPLLMYDVKNGICLCEKHHKLIKDKEHLYIEIFMEIINAYYSRHKRT